MIEYREHITRSMLRAEPDVLFVFGDNMVRFGRGGQAKEMRGEPNAVGIPTKMLPDMKESAFLTDADLDNWQIASAADRARLMAHEGKIVWPVSDIGTGLAQLQQRAPTIWGAIQWLKSELEFQK